MAGLPKDYSAQLTYQGRIREYLVHLPANYRSFQTYPLVLVFHGGSGTPEQMRSLTRFNDTADTDQFIVVYPKGIEKSWADGRGTTPAELAGVDDVGFVSTLINQLVKNLTIDSRKVYATGISNGGLFSQRLGCELSNKITAIAPVAATFPAKLAPTCQPQRAVPVLQIMGTQDPLIPFEGGTVPPGRFGSGGDFLSNDDAIAVWLKINACRPFPATTLLPNIADDGTIVERRAYQNCTGTAQVHNYIIRGGGHTWPGGLQYLPERIIGKTSRDIQASPKIWQFFNQFTRL
ncbi:MAG: PHB depolymerase family esterase [Thermosynechococcaceae cyanobacterium]